MVADAGLSGKVPGGILVHLWDVGSDSVAAFVLHADFDDACQRASLGRLRLWREFVLLS